MVGGPPYPKDRKTLALVGVAQKIVGKSNKCP